MKGNIFDICKKIFYTLILPVAVFVVFYIVTKCKGIQGFGNWYTWKMILINAASSVCLASVLGLNLKNGRMDLSSGANLILSGILAYTVTKAVNGNGIVLLVFCVIFAVMFSALTAAVYITMKIPMVITAIGMVLLYESLTKIVNGGNGVNIVSTSSLNYWGYIPWAYVLGVLSLVIYYIVTKYSIIGYESDAITNNQLISANIGINEKKTVFSIFLISGVILGFGAAIYLSGNIVQEQSNLTSVRIVYSNFLPIIVGLYLARYSNDIIGILVGSITIATIRYGLNLVGLSDWEDIVVGIFIIVFSIVTSSKFHLWTKMKAILRR